MNTAQETAIYSEVALQAHQDLNENLNQNYEIPPKTQQGNEKAKESNNIVLLVSPAQNLSRHSLEETKNIGQHQVYEAEMNLLQEQHGKEIAMVLPEYGVHDLTPYNQHLTGRGSSQGSDVWLVPLQNQEKLTNIYHRKTNHFLSHHNLNLSNLDADLDLREPISVIDLAAFGIGVGDLHGINGLTTEDFGQTNDPNPLLNMYNVFEAETSLTQV